MPKFRKKPVEVEAFQLPPPDVYMHPDLIHFLHDMHRQWKRGDDGTVIIHTLEGDMTGQPLDYIIKGVQGEYYPCKPDIFKATYEIVT
ncbi:MAG: hypothetical protein V3W41_22580 [Planctomycetota bacterium]